MKRHSAILLLVLAATLAAASQRQRSGPIVAPLPGCDYRQLGRAAAAFIDHVPPAPPELPEPEECFGKVCEARAARLAAFAFYERMTFEERLWAELDTQRRACGF
jgi:hypothetical protein